MVPGAYSIWWLGTTLCGGWVPLCVVVGAHSMRCLGPGLVATLWWTGPTPCIDWALDCSPREKNSFPRWHKRQLREDCPVCLVKSITAQSIKDDVLLES